MIEAIRGLARRLQTSKYQLRISQGAVMYDPSIGRWLEEDPLGFDADDSNLYRYVHNSPQNFVDPSGLFPNEMTQSDAQLQWFAYLQEQTRLVPYGAHPRPTLSFREWANNRQISIVTAQGRLDPTFYDEPDRLVREYQGSPFQNRPLGQEVRDALVERIISQLPTEVVQPIEAGFGSILSAVLKFAIRNGLRGARIARRLDPRLLGPGFVEACRRLAINPNLIQIQDRTVRIVQGLVNTIDRTHIRTLAEQFRAQGANAVEVTAIVQNPRLLEVLRNPRAARLLLGQDVEVIILREFRLGDVVEALVQLNFRI